MLTNRRLVFHLVALGRITPTEAERLLIAANEGRESLWVAAALIAAVFLAQLHLQAWLPVLMHMAHSLRPETLFSAHRALALFIQLLGGIR